MKEKRKAGWLICSGVLFGFFLLNIFLGKAALVLEQDRFLELSDVEEFLLLFLAVICFVIEVLRRESPETKADPHTVNSNEEE